MDIDDFLLQCRSQGYFNLSDIEIALLEFNGTISILPKTEKRPANCTDLSLNVDKETINLTIITDHHIIYNNLKYIGKDEVWLNKQLASLGFNGIDDVFLAICDLNGNLNAFKKDENGGLNNLFE